MISPLEKVSVRLIHQFWFLCFKALKNAFKEASCASPTASKVVIPACTYKNIVDLKGPCKAPLTVQVDGTIQAPADPA